MKKLSEVVNSYQLDYAPETLPSLLGEVESHLANLERQGLHSDAIQLRSLFEEMDYRESTSRQNAGEERKKANQAADHSAVLEERVSTLVHQMDSLKLDKQALEFELSLVRQGIRDEIQGAFEDGEAMAMTGIAMRLGHVLGLDSDLLESMLVQAIDGSVDSAVQLMNELLDAMERTTGHAARPPNSVKPLTVCWLNLARWNGKPSRY